MLFIVVPEKVDFYGSWQRFDETVDGGMDKFTVDITELVREAVREGGGKF